MLCELRSHRWIQLPEDEALESQEQKHVNVQDAYKYDIEDGTYYELHVDDSTIFCDRMKDCFGGGNLSVRKQLNMKLVIMFEQDESIFKPFAMASKAWMSPTGERPLVPKDNEAGPIISAYMSREFGHRFRDITLTENVTIHNYRRRQSNKNEQSTIEKVAICNISVTKPKDTVLRIINT